MSLGHTDTAAAPLITGYDAALFDLDGVVYLGPTAVDGAPEGLAELRSRGVQIGFVTNNAARSPQHVADHLSALGVEAAVADVVTSAQACARLMAAELPAGSRVLVTGTSALADEVAGVGLQPVSSSTDDPVAVVQGYDPTMSQPRLDEACHAIQRGARWFATNTDSTRPTDRGLVPGAGSQIQVVGNAVSATPIVAGKPFAPLMHETVRRLEATAPIFVGDRIDTDIMGAVGVGMDSLFVFTGAHGKYDLAAAGPEGRPTWLGWDLRALLAPARRALTAPDGSVTCGAATAHTREGRVVLELVPVEREQQLDALWAVLTALWAGSHTADDTLAALDQIP